MRFKISSYLKECEKNCKIIQKCLKLIKKSHNVQKCQNTSKNLRTLKKNQICSKMDKNEEIFKTMLEKKFEKKFKLFNN